MTTGLQQRFSATTHPTPARSTINKHYTQPLPINPDRQGYNPTIMNKYSAAFVICLAFYGTLAFILFQENESNAPDTSTLRISTVELDSLRKEYVNLILEEQRVLDSLQTGKKLMVK